MPRRKRADYTYKPYDAKFHPFNLITMMSQRLTNAQVAAAWNISLTTLDRWREEHSELEEAYQQGLTNYEAAMQKEIWDPMLKGTLEGKHSFNAAKLIAKNKLGWSLGESGTSNTQVNIGNVNVNAAKSIEQLKEELQKNVSFLIDKNVITEAEFKVLTNDRIDNQEEPNRADSDQE